MNQEKTNKRRIRYKRDAEKPRPGIFQSKGDGAIILLIHEYRYLTRPLLEVLTGRKGTSLKNRLRYLYDNGYLWKVQFSRSYTETGSTPDIYVLDEKGRELYHEITGQKAEASPKRNQSKWISGLCTSFKRNQNKDPQLEHALLINTIRAMITAVCNEGNGIKLLDWQKAGNDAKDYVKVDGRKMTIAPDAFFVLQKDGGKAIPFFLEADRSTMDQPTFVSKLSSYYTYYRKIREELDSQKGQGKVELTNRFNIKGFRVLTVIEHDKDWQKVRNRNRLNHLIDAGYKATEGKGWKGFWYTSKGNFDLSDPGSILKPIWQIAHPEEAGKPQAII
jgi:hypothetical protein